MSPVHTFILFVPGIRTKTRGIDCWHEKAVEWMHLHTPFTARHYEYHCWATTRWLRQSERVEDVASLLHSYRSATRIIGAGHSNGCEILRRALVENPDVRIDNLYLFAPAVAADYDANGLNRVCAEKPPRVQSIDVYYSSNDDVLKGPAKWSRRLFGWAGLGYGDMGLIGPQNMRGWADTITVRHPSAALGHSDWLDPRTPNFQWAMEEIANL